MGKTYPAIDDSLRAFIQSQHVFFVATAPRDQAGHVNVSPKGLDTFRILGPTRVGYADFTGSGIETVAHLRENGRLTIMLCAFDGRPNILRLYGRGSVHEPTDPGFAKLAPHFDLRSPVRSIIELDVTRITDSCGWGVPLYDYQGQRTQLVQSVEKKGPEGLAEYHARKNARSIDGLPGLPSVTPPHLPFP